LKFKIDNTITTSNYIGTSITGLTNSIAAYGGNQTYWFYVNVSGVAIHGLTVINAKCTYDDTGIDSGAEFTDSWTVMHGSDLNIDMVSSSTNVVHPGDSGLPISILINNPGPNTAYIDDVDLVFWKDGVDISDLFLVSSPTPSYPIGPFAGDQLVTFTVTVSAAITSGSVIINATTEGRDSTSDISISDLDGAETIKTWAVQTWPAPVISSIEANATTYGVKDTIQLTVTCDNDGYSVSANFDPIDSGAGSVFGSDNGDSTYTIIHKISSGNPPDGNKIITVTAINTTTSAQDQDTKTLKQGDQPDFSGLVLIPTAGYIDVAETVTVQVIITDIDGVEAYLEYKVNLGVWIYLDMSILSGDLWTVDIPGQLGGAFVQYRIIASDPAGNSKILTSEYQVNIIFPQIIDSYPHEESNPGNIYNIGNPAPRDTNISHYAQVDSGGIIESDVYIIVVNAFDSKRHAFLEANTCVIIQEGSLVDIFINLIIPSSVVNSGEYIYGHVYLLTDWPKNGGQIIASDFFEYNVS
jgi:hypothetical protein